MGKLIDADRAASIENLDQYSAFAAGIGCVQDVRDVLNDAPAVDAVPVVRCAKCKHHGTEYGYLVCKHPDNHFFTDSSTRVDQDFFCSDGIPAERKEQ